MAIVTCINERCTVAIATRYCRWCCLARVMQSVTWVKAVVWFPVWMYRSERANRTLKQYISILHVRVRIISNFHTCQWTTYFQHWNLLQSNWWRQIQDVLLTRFWTILLTRRIQFDYLETNSIWHQVTQLDKVWFRLPKYSFVLFNQIVDGESVNKHLYQNHNCKRILFSTIGILMPCEGQDQVQLT